MAAIPCDVVSLLAELTATPPAITCNTQLSAPETSESFRGPLILGGAGGLVSTCKQGPR